MRSDCTGMRKESTGMWSERTGMWSDCTSMWSESTGVWSDCTGVRNDSTDVWNDSTGMWNGCAGLRNRCASLRREGATISFGSDGVSPSPIFLEGWDGDNQPPSSGLRPPSPHRMGRRTGCGDRKNELLPRDVAHPNFVIVILIVIGRLGRLGLRLGLRLRAGS